MPSQDDGSFTLKPSIPQLFYDVIARIVPGAVIVGVLALAVAGPEKSARVVEEWLNKRGDQYPSITLMVFVGFVSSYTLAIVLLGCWHLVSAIVCKTGLDAYLPNWTKISSDAELPMKYDFIKTNDPMAGSRITKLTAERHMAGILIFGLSLALLVNLSNMFGPFDGSRVIPAVAIGFSIAGSVGALWHFSHVQELAINNYASLLSYPAKETTRG